jgi:hypothetical protein
MKLFSYYRSFSLIFIISVLSVPVYADSFGRLFTTPGERKELDRIRIIKEKKPRQVEAIQLEEFVEPVKKEIVVRDAIRLKGIVHRSDGKNSAWINEANTFEGNLESQFIQVPNNNITNDQATVVMPDDSTSVNLKVGEVFVPPPLEREMVESETN